MKNLLFNLMIWKQLNFGLFGIILFGCSNEKVGSESLLSGANSKTWRSDIELDAVGSEQMVADAEQRTSIQFYADGRFALGGDTTLHTGIWSFDQTAKRLTLQFEEEEEAQNFEVLQLTDDELDLRTSKGTKLELVLDK